MGSQDQHRPTGPQNAAEALERAAALRRERRAKSIRDAAAIEQHRRVVVAHRTPGGTAPALDDNGGDVA